MWESWPRCPECERRRQAVCPVCQVAGVDFELADNLAPLPPPVQPSRGAAGAESTAEELEILLICPTCDEAFAPQFYRFCEACGHEFAGGTEIGAVPREELTARAVATILALLLVALASTIYFWFILAR